MSVQFSQPGLLDAYKQVLQQRESSLFLYSTLPPPSRSLSILPSPKNESIHRTRHLPRLNLRFHISHPITRVRPVLISKTLERPRDPR